MSDETPSLHPLRRLLIAVVLLGVGFLGVRVVLTLFPTDATWEAQIRADAVEATKVLRPWSVPELPPEFIEGWDAQLRPYDEERRADLRARLQTYLDFLEAEYAEAADIYVSGTDPRRMSDGVQAVRERLRAAFGDEADRMLADADQLREDAYRLSPKIGGLDPDAPDFREDAASVRQWMEIARPRVDALTAPPGER